MKCLAARLWRARRPRSPQPRAKQSIWRTATMLGFAIVGCGMIARFHARALAEVPGAQLRAVVSRSQTNAAKMIQELKLSCTPATDLDAVLRRKDIDVVIITTPSGAHLEPSLAAAN